MKLPNADRAIIDIRKLTEYSLNLRHRHGKEKAVLFRDLLGLTLESAQVLYDALTDAVRIYDAEETILDEYGQRYRIDFPMETPHGSAIVRSGWIVHIDEDFPRLTTCYIRKE
jgi:hypothetical protein